MTHSSPRNSNSTDQALVKLLFVISILLFAATGSLARANVPTPLGWLDADAFVRAVADLAVRERERSGVPASIKAAQAILESDWGRAPVARSGNNYFGIKCKSYWTGKTVMHPDDDRDARGKLVPSCFRAYGAVEDSFRDHSDFLRGSARYAALFELPVTDYKAWAHGLRQCGYATDKAYGDKLVALIERLNLYALDWPDAEETGWLMKHSESGVPFLDQPQILKTEEASTVFAIQDRRRS